MTFYSKERARNNLSILSPHPNPLPEGEGVSCSSYFVRVPKRLESDQAISATHRIRKEGRGRKKLRLREPELLSSLEALVEPTTHSDPENPLLWTFLR